MRLFQNINTQARLLVALLCMSIIPAVFIGIYAYRTSTDTITEKLAASAKDAIRLLDSSMTAELSRYSLFIDSVSTSDEVQTKLSGGFAETEESLTLENVIFHGSYFRNLYVADKDGKKLYDAGWTRLSAGRLEELMMNAEVASPRDSLSRTGNSPTSNLAIGRKIFHFPEGQDHIGYVFAFFNPNLITGLYNEDSFGGGKMALLTSAGLMLTGTLDEPGTHFGNTELLIRLKEARALGEQSFTAEAGGVQSLIVFSYNRLYDTYMMAAIPLSYIQDDAGQAGRSTTLFAAVSAVLCVVISLWIYRDVERRKRELELLALQYQINPHFLFNTLGTLKWVAVINEAPKAVSEGITSLAQLLQGVLVSKDAMIPLREELDNLAHYFTIQNIRYADCFEVVNDVDETLLDNRVPRFILQPLAENAVLHGSEGGGKQIIITVRCRRERKGVLLEIADNGSGFDQEKLKIDGPRFSGIGLSNVDERLKLHFGGRHGLKINSAVGEGTVCSILIPEISGKADNL